MSNHHSQKSINLHHSQVSAGKDRRQERQVTKMQGYLARRIEARREQWWIISFCVMFFSYSMIASAVYLGYIL